MDQERVSLAISEPTDPNLDPNWNWNDINAQYIRVYGKNSLGSPIDDPGALGSNMTLPWLTAGNPLAVPNPDIKTEDGWVLVFKDVGTPTRRVEFPFFAVYNKYRGTLRFFIRNAQNTSANYFIARLSYNDKNYTASSLSFTADSASSTMSDYSRFEEQSVLSHSNTYNSWHNFDFVLANYDPNNTANSWLRLDLYKVEESQIKLESQEFSLVSEYVSSIQSGGTTNSGGIGKAIQNGQKFFGSLDAFRKGLADANKEHKNAILNKIITSKYAEAIPYIGSALKFISSFIGGKNTPYPWQMMKLNGKLKMDGTIVNERPEYSINLSLVKGSPLSASHYQPVTNIKFGIFNLTSTPNLVANMDLIADEDPQWPGVYEYWLQGNITVNNSANLILNPELNMTLISKKIKFFHTFSNGWLVSEYDSGFKDLSSVVTWPYSMYFGQNSGDFYRSNLKGQIGIELIFRINGATTLDNEVVFLKTYRAESNAFGY